MLSATTQGGDSPAGDTRALTATSSLGTVSAPLALTGWQKFQTAKTAPIEVGDDGLVTVSASLSLSAGTWGTFDDVRLERVAANAAPDTIALSAALKDAATGIDRSLYTVASLATLDHAVEVANVVLAGSRATQESVDAARVLVTDAVAGLVKIADGEPSEPGTGEPGTGEPSTGLPETGEPGTGEPGTGLPETGEPGTGLPETGLPGTGQPGTASVQVSLGLSTVRAGEPLNVKIQGLTGASIEIGIASTYQALATVPVANGVASATVTIPATLAAGIHHIQARDAAGALLAEAEITVTAAATSSAAGSEVTTGSADLASTGVELRWPFLAGLLLLLAGAGVLVRRRMFGARS